MAGLEPEKIRSFTLLGSSGSGKTTLAEALMFRAQVTHRLGKVDDSTSHLDTDPEEHRRKISLFGKIQTLSWDGHRIHFADTPGFPEFIGEAIAPLAVLDAAIIVVDATVGVDVHAKRLFQLAVLHKRPILFFINKMDKENADFERSLESIRNNLSKKAHPVVLPVGQGADFRGVLDLIDGRAFIYEGDKFKETTVPFEEEERFKAAQKKLMEEVAETDEALFERMANGETLSKEDVLPRLIQDIEEEEILPVLVGSSNPSKGSHLLLDALTHLILPPPKLPPIEGCDAKSGEKDVRRGLKVESATGQIFKVVSDPGVGEIYYMKLFSGTLKHGEDLYNARSKENERINHLFQLKGKDRVEVSEAVAGDVVLVPKLKNSQVGDTLSDPARPFEIPAIAFPKPVLSLAIHPKTRHDQEKLGNVLGKILSSDPAFHYRIDPEFAETIVSGMGEVHIEVVTERLKAKYGIEVTLGTPHVPYRETITGKVRVQGRYKKQTGGHGQFGDVWIRLEPKALGEGFEFVDEIRGGAIPGKYIPPVEKGIREASQHGVLAGYPVVDFKVVLDDGSFHSVDSSDLAFQIAGSLAFKKAEQEAHPILLEPIMKLTVIAPPEFVGAITNDLAARRGKVVGMDQEGDLHVIQGEVPMAELFRYATDLRGFTHGAGTSHAEFTHYQALPPHLLDKVLKEHSRLKKDAAAS